MASAGNEDAAAEQAPDSRARLMQEVAAQMEAIEADFGDGYAIGSTVIIVEVLGPDGAATIRVRSNAPPWTGLGMLRIAEKGLEGQGEE